MDKSEYMVLNSSLAAYNLSVLGHNNLTLCPNILFCEKDYTNDTSHRDF